jgi:hypothetical protein
MQTILCTPAPDTKKSARKPGRLQAEFRKICDAFLSDASLCFLKRFAYTATL